MKPRSPVSSSPIVATLALGALLTVPVMAQYSGTGSGQRQRGPLENNRIRLTQLSVEPGATLPAGGNQVLVYLTADPDGRFPAEAVWQAAGAGAVQNRGPARLDAISIELKDVQGTSSGTPPEALDAQYGVEVTRLDRQPTRVGHEAAIRADGLRWPAALSWRGRAGRLPARRLYVAPHRFLGRDRGSQR